MSKLIEEMYAFVILDDGQGNGDEGIPAFNSMGMAMPLVGADMERMDSLMPMAKNIAEKTGQKIELRKFKLVEVIDLEE